MVHWSLLLISALAGVNSILAAERQSDARPQGVFRVTSELVQFDALFLDDEGHPVMDVRKTEVTVTQSGRVVPLADLRFERRPMAAPAGLVGQTASRAAGTIEPEPWIFLIDDLAMSPDAFVRAKEGLQTFLQQELPSSVQVGVLRTGELGHRTTQLSADRAGLLRAVTDMRYRNNRWRGGLTSRSGATGAGTAGKDRVFLEGTLGSLNSLLLNLRQLPGRKIVVVMSELVALTASEANHAPGGLNIVPTVEYANVADRLRRLGRLAAEAGVTVHSIDLAGVNNLASKEQATLTEGLHAVADELGGVYFGKSNDVGDLLARLVATEQGQYILAYVPPIGTFEDRGTVRFVPITVEVSRPGVTVRTRSGFFTR